MSRIERALEKAALRRRSVDAEDAPPEGIPVLPDAPLSEREKAATTAETVLVAISDPGSPVAEEYRKLKIDIAGRFSGSHDTVVILISSAVGGEGKTVTSINLAASLADGTDEGILLIDADLRKPSVDRYLGLSAEKGLADCLQEGSFLPETVVPTDVGTLSVLPSGKSPVTPVELFSSRRLSGVLDGIRKCRRYRYVIIDSPPALPFAEPRCLSRVADATLLVVKEGKVSLDDLQKTVEALNTKVTGVVFNDAHPQKAESMYGYYGYYHRRSLNAGPATVATRS